MKKAELSIEALLKIVLVIFLAFIVFAVLFIILKPAIDNLRGTSGETEEPTKGVFDMISNLFGGCKDSKERCVGGYSQYCDDGKWVTEMKCEDGCADEGDECA